MFVFSLSPFSCCSIHCPPLVAQVSVLRSIWSARGGGRGLSREGSHRGESSSLLRRGGGCPSRGKSHRPPRSKACSACHSDDLPPVRSGCPRLRRERDCVGKAPTRVSECGVSFHNDRHCAKGLSLHRACCCCPHTTRSKSQGSLRDLCVDRHPPGQARTSFHSSTNGI